MREGGHLNLHGVHIGDHSDNTSCNNTNHSQEKEKEKENTWVRNLSNTPLTEVKTKVLAHGPNFTVVPRCPPVGEYISAIEHACNQLQQGKAEELRGEVKSILKKIQAPKHNITGEERKVIDELRKDKSRIILTADKGVSMVVMDRDDYNRKAEDIPHQSAYKPIPNDPTNKYKNKLNSLLKSIKTEGGIDKSTYKRLYTTGAGTPKFYGLPKVHKEYTTQNHSIQHWGSDIYNNKRIVWDPKAPGGEITTPHSQNQDFIEHFKVIQLGPDEIMVSYDVKALFTSVPIQPALSIIEKLLKEDTGLQNRTTMSVKHIMDLLEFCLRSTYFTYQGKYFEQVEGPAMGSLISPIVPNLYMENSEVRALNTSPVVHHLPLHTWL